MLATPNPTRGRRLRAPSRPTPHSRGRRARLGLECLEERISLARDLLVASRNNALRYDGDTGAFVGTFTSGGGPGALEDLVFGPDGNLYASSAFTNSVRRYDGTTGAFLNTFASGGELFRPSGLTFGPDGHLYVANSLNDTVKRYNGATGAFLDNFTSGGGLFAPRGVTFGPDGNLYVTSAHGRVVRYHGTTGTFLDNFASGGGLSSPESLTFGPDGHLYVIGQNDAVKRYHGTTGAFLGDFASGLINPRGLRFGPDGNLYVTNGFPSQIKRYNGTTGAFIDNFASGGELFAPSSLTFFPDPAPDGPTIVLRTPQGVADAISSLRVIFDRAINPLTFTVDDITNFTGQLGELRPTAVTPVPGSNNAWFDITFPLQAITGLYGMAIGPNIADAKGNLMDQDRDGVLGEFDDRYLAVFGLEGARVMAATSVAVTPPGDRFQLTFNRAMNPGTFVDWVGLQGPSGAIPLTGAAAVPNTGQRVIEVFFAPQTAPGRYTYTVLPGVRDVWGNPMDQNRNFIGGEIPGDEFVGSFTLASAFSVVVPNNLANTEGTFASGFPFNIAVDGLPSMRYQQIYARSQFPGGGTIDKIRFRQDGSQFGTAFSTTGIDVQISIGYAARSVHNASATFADNIGAGYVTVFDGLLSLSSAPSGQVPRPFDIVIDLDDLFSYDPGQGDLLVDIRMRNAPRTTQFDNGDSTQQSVTTRIFRADVNELTGIVGEGFGGGTRPSGLVTQFDIAGGGGAPFAGGGSLPALLDRVRVSLALTAASRVNTTWRLPAHERLRTDAVFAAVADEPARLGLAPAEEAGVRAAGRRDGEAAGPLFELDLLAV